METICVTVCTVFGTILIFLSSLWLVVCSAKVCLKIVEEAMIFKVGVKRYKRIMRHIDRLEHFMDIRGMD